MDEYVKYLAKVNICLISVLLFFNIATEVKGSVIQEIEFENSRNYRITSDITGSNCWIVEQRVGLIHLFKHQSGYWQFTRIPIPGIYDFIGPDSNGNLFISYATGTESGVHIFDCEAGIISESIIIGVDYNLKGLALSTNGNFLYVVGPDWPRCYEWGGEETSPSHRDSGLVWEINLTSMSITDSTSVSAFPETLIYINNKIFIYNKETEFLFNISPNAETVLMDVVTTGPRLARIAQIRTTCCTGAYINEFIPWSDTEPKLAMINTKMDLVMGETDPLYTSTIWLINTETNEVVDSVQFVDEERHGVTWASHGIVSQVYQNRVYLTSYKYVYAIEKDTGAIIDRIDCGDGNLAEFVYELPDGRLIVTCGESGTILIIEPD